MRILKHVLLVALLFSIIIGNAQSDEQSKAIFDFLENTKLVSVRQISDNNLSKISNATIYYADLSFDMENSGYGNTVNSAYFIKEKKEFKAFNQAYDLLGSDTFINSLKKFTIKSNEDAIQFQTALLLFDDQKFNDGFFKKDNQWTFVRKEFFNQAELIVVTTNEKGKIIKIEYQHEREMPEYESIAAREELQTEPNDTKTSEKDSLKMLKYLSEKVDYNFTIKEQCFPELKSLSNADFYLIELKVNEVEGDVSSTTTWESNLMAFQNQFYNTSSPKTLIKSGLFLKSIKPDYVIANNDDAANFESILDALLPVSSNEAEFKSHSKLEDDIWAFTRGKSFDQKQGWLVQLNEKNQMKQLTYGEISEIAVLRIRMQDPEYKVDYAFKLNYPKTTDVIINEGEGLEIEIMFNEMPVNAAGAWIMTRFDGQNMGIMASTQMTSPFYEEVPSQELRKGKHVLEYLLLMPGEDTDNTLGEIIINITVN